MFNRISSEWLFFFSDYKRVGAFKSILYYHFVEITEIVLELFNVEYGINSLWGKLGDTLQVELG